MEVNNMSTKRKRRSPKFKFQVALDAAKEAKTINQLASEHGLHSSQISQRKGQLLNDGATVFSTTAARQQRERESLQAELYEQIGRLKPVLSLSK